VSTEIVPPERCGCQAPLAHEPGECHDVKGRRCRCTLLIILDQPAKAGCPSKDSLNDPPFWRKYEARSASGSFMPFDLLRPIRSGTCERAMSRW
jgi:hypothetical protein